MVANLIIFFTIFLPLAMPCPFSELDVYNVLNLNNSKRSYLARPVNHYNTTVHIEISFGLKSLTEIVI